MSREPRVRLDAPFIRAASESVQPMTDAASAQGFQRPANDSVLSGAAPSPGTESHLRRASVPQRAQADYSGETMARYINGLDARLIAHIRKHAPRWHDAETARVLRRWTIPKADHPAPSWATPRDVQADARDYAGQLVRMRIVAKMQRLHDIRVARTLGGHGEVDPLTPIFHGHSVASREMKPRRTKRIQQ